MVSKIKEIEGNIMKKIIYLPFVLIIILGLMSGAVMAEGAMVTNTMAVDLISVLDCPTVGFALIHYLDNDELYIQIETTAPPEAMAGAVFEFRYGEGEEEQTHRFTVNEHGRGSLHLKTAALADQHLNVWILDSPDWALEMFAEHPRLLVVDGHMHALESEVLIAGAM